MPTPAEARSYYARKRRRVKQNQSAFDVAGYFAAPFDFGAMLVGQDSPNSLLLPADVNIAIGSTVALSTADVFIGDNAETWGIQTAIIAGAITDVPELFSKNQTIVVTRGDTAPAAVLELFFRGPKSELIKFGDCVFT